MHKSTNNTVVLGKRIKVPRKEKNDTDGSFGSLQRWK